MEGVVYKREKKSCFMAGWNMYISDESEYSCWSEVICDRDSGGTRGGGGGMGGQMPPQLEALPPHLPPPVRMDFFFFFFFTLFYFFYLCRKSHQSPI